ncbi:putative GMC oxidoreductase [Annulohypoxylon truncatum]|uniref:putative GMC oxidoreductase n=1 Tax=Annulohypoxylon truncatum TaxID=327061 RepID=UPI0020074B99|nr:putative GMC oxidoreductase [Annulohypoxylon truncatum]KAI1212824.1 putative GMC oxidoreductase [Annulohypoxylon truncatum]
MRSAYIAKLGFVTLLFAANGPFTQAHHHSELQLRFLNGSSQVRSSYDYVIVGAGTAGLTIADRLTADGESTVLVVENGDIVDSPRIRQVYSGAAAMGPTWSYQINSVPQANLNNRSTAVLAGNLVGGSSAINAMMTVRGTSEDYDRWGGFFGDNSSWSWDGLLPYLKKALNFVPPDPAVAELVNITYDTSYWGNSSGVYAGWPYFQWPGLTTQIEAFKDIPGVEFPPDSGAGKAGVYWFPTFMDPKLVQRSYARTGHFDGINRTNHDVVTKSHVTKILLEDGTATGVVFRQKIGNATTHITVKANREVILSAGAIHSPQILQLSGIGPQKLLQSAGINTSVDLPGVGQNFQDHPMMFMSIVLANFTTHPSPSDMFGNPNFTDWAEELWKANKTGPYSMGIGNAAAWLGMPVISPERFESIASKLESQDHAAHLPPETDETVIAGYSAQMKNMASSIRSSNTAFYNHVLSGGGSSGSLIDLHPLSRGTVNINTTDPFNTEPIVDYRALSNPIDLDVMVEFLRFTKRYFFETRLKELIPRQVQPPDYVNEPEDLAGFLAENLSPSEFHPSGTCAMMPRELGGVVDESLKVYGVKNLRVVDASIMPTLPGANTCQTVYAIAEKAVDLIKADLQLGQAPN